MAFNQQILKPSQCVPIWNLVAEFNAAEFEGLSQILCKHRNAVQIEQNLFKAEVAQAAAALFSK